MSVLRARRFRFLIALQFGNAIGVWSQVVAGQWVLVEAGASSATVSLVPAFISLPFLVLAIPLGSIVTHRPRELLMAIAAFTAALASGGVAVATHLELVHPNSVLTATLVIGIGLVCVGTAWQALLPETIDRALLSQAAVIDGATFNAARALGPMLAGIGLALVGPEWIFGANAAVFAVCAALMAWSGYRWPSRVGAREPLWRSVRVGLGFVRHSPWTTRLLMRLAAFSLPAACLWALLPVAVHDRLGFGSLGLGVTTGMLGVGAVLGTFVIAPVRARMSVNVFAAAGTTTYALALLALAISSSGPLVVALMLPAGMAWVGVQSTWMMLSNQALPDWVRPRVVAIVLFVSQVTQAFGAVLWGVVADWLGLSTAIVLAAALMAGTVYGFWRRGLRTADGMEPEQMVSEQFDGVRDILGRVQIEFVYTVAEDRVAEFLDAMRELRRSRLRLGAEVWALLRAPDDRCRFVERVRFRSGSDLYAQGHDRLTIPEFRLRERVELIATSVAGPDLLNVVDAWDIRNIRTRMRGTREESS